VVPQAARHPPWWFPHWPLRFLCEATTVFQPYCVITGWVGSPCPDSNPTLKKHKNKLKKTTIVVYTPFVNTSTPFFVLGLAIFRKS